MIFEEWVRRIPELLFVLPLLTFLLGILLAWQLMRWGGRLRGRGSQRRGRRAEKQAARLLKKRGYEILAVAPVIESQLMVDGEPRRFAITPDFLVSDGMRELVVEVKRYHQSNSIANAGIRRQVLEYLYAAERPCLLVAMPEGTIEEIDLH
jgi:hypothetical protein